MKKTAKKEVEKGNFYTRYNNNLLPAVKEQLRLLVQLEMPISKASYYRKFAERSWNNSEIEFIEKRIFTLIN